MQDLTYTALNEFLVGAFNEILRIEGRVRRAVAPFRISPFARYMS